MSERQKNFNGNLNSNSTGSRIKTMPNVKFVTQDSGILMNILEMVLDLLLLL